MPRKNAPRANKQPYKISTHEHSRIDNYYWLQDRENSEVINYLNAENAYTQQQLAHTESLQEALFIEMKARLKPDNTSVPYFDNGFYYYDCYEENQEYATFYRKRLTLDAPEQVLLDTNKLAEGFDYFQIGDIAISPNNQFMVYSVDSVGRRLYTLYIVDLLSDERLVEVISGTSGSIQWCNDNKTFFYVKKDPDTLRDCHVMRHRLGERVATDVEVFFEADEAFYCYVDKTRSEDFILIGCQSTVSSEYLFLNADTPEGQFQVLEPRQRNHEYYVDHINGTFYITTNFAAKNFRLMQTSQSATRKNEWSEVIAHRDNVLLEDVELFDNYLVTKERHAGLSKLCIYNLRTNSHYYIDIDQAAYSLELGDNCDSSSTVLRFEFSSPTTPDSFYDYDMQTREQTLLKREEVTGGFDAEDYVSERIHASTRDGTRVPISIVYRKNIVGGAQTATHPLLLYAYGSYGHSVETVFSNSRISLLDRGFIFAIAHVRGGEELGRDWYENGKLLKKKNTFYDFIDCAEHLLAQRYANPKKLFAYGGSAGGMLMGVVANERPDLFTGIVAAVPFVDCVTTMLDDTIPLTTGEYDEWGNPQDKEFYDYMLSYSPYDNVEEKDYPNMLVTTGLHDSQVQYWEPAKWVAKLRELKTDDNLLLLHTEMGLGHGGASGRYEIYREIALEYAFFLDLALNDVQTTVYNSSSP